MSSLNLEQKILEVIVYFDLFDYPLTTLEVWQNLRFKASYSEVHDALNRSDRLKLKNGFWVLNESNVAKRQQRYRASKYKLDKARRFVRVLKLIPWVQAVYACNSLGFWGSRPESDIDFFIVTRQGRIWSTRFFTVLLAKLLVKRPTAEHCKDAFCFSFYAAEGVDMRRAAIDQDVYFLYWNTKLLPLFERGNTSERFWGRNRWVNKELPQAEPIRLSSCVLGKKRRKWGSVGEGMLRALQLRIMPSCFKEMAGKGSSVILDNEFLKFHNHDRRNHIKNQFNARLAEI